MLAGEFVKDAGFETLEVGDADQAIAILESHSEMPYCSPTSTCPEAWTVWNWPW
jgi:hypothetical protein